MNDATAALKRGPWALFLFTCEVWEQNDSTSLKELK